MSEQDREAKAVVEDCLRRMEANGRLTEQALAALGQAECRYRRCYAVACGEFLLIIWLGCALLGRILG